MGLKGSTDICWIRLLLTATSTSEYNFSSIKQIMTHSINCEVSVISSVHNEEADRSRLTLFARTPECRFSEINDFWHDLCNTDRLI